MTLALFASNPAQSRGRLHDEGRDEMRGPRDAFQRDRDRIIHSVAFRRLRGKTQVFVAPDGDHFRVRLTHSLEVAQIGRTIARALGLNEDLTEALCLAHDIGHPPFGHAGEDALQVALAGSGGFDHNAQTLRMLTRLEHRYPRFAGLNLSWETLEGLAKHNGPIDDPSWALADVDAEHELDLDSFASLEAQVATLADDIAYDNHDIDDGLRAGLFDRGTLFAIPEIAEIWERAAHRFPDAGPAQLASELIREQIGLMVNDLIAETRARVADAAVASADDVRAAGRQLAAFSPAMAEHERTLKRFLYANMYEHPKQEEVADAVRAVVEGLYAAYHADPALLPENWRNRLPDEEPHRARHIADFIAGMTDGFAIRCYREVVGPLELPEGF
ncbi:deoxyguanosinetriphosphate triphosphohydrolase [Parasphingopyxis algicola]|uniref:deoxyguanosinetriphosphate triphosphohydrolase n=1 Tax=Parasphingopyxis algicola TaxID=2026624 RepID=UPI0015A1572B|nr:deoxyguanosinetriphosphate triphosphohydrolase [Parasphingopyxis algicola]QLC26299.1 deoxyguanosinetriphosphate triphosphohydrolase [Parasphingopyxis algicola]